MAGDITVSQEKTNEAKMIVIFRYLLLAAIPVLISSFKTEKREIGWFDHILIPRENALPRKLEEKKCIAATAMPSLIELF